MGWLITDFRFPAKAGQVGLTIFGWVELIVSCLEWDLWDFRITGFCLLTLKDVNGRIVRVIANGNFPADTHEITFDRGSLAASIYFLQLKTSEGVVMKKLILE